jgi:transcriptional regulator with XRE-family HTH domain
MSIEIEQVRAARELLDWTQARLADAAGISLSIVKNFESEQRLPTEENFVAIWSAFDEAGVVFDSETDSLGVRIKRKRGTIYQKPLDARQSRAARKLLNWSQSCLSQAALVSFGAVRNFEGNHRPTAEAKLLAMLGGFERAGVVFENDRRFVAVRAKIRRA